MDGIDEGFKVVKNERVNRITTGIERLDQILNGGLPNNSVTLVSGTPGSGKTIMCFHYLLAPCWSAG
ncbi:MAG: hypothetical protein LN364_03375 [Candidatus Thermoplasmatota archaeon]|nr:hypothetical protein [Candidatus Thermoplasmatota archaeon]